MPIKAFDFQYNFTYSSRQLSSDVTNLRKYKKIDQNSILCIVEPIITLIGQTVDFRYELYQYFNFQICLALLQVSFNNFVEAKVENDSEFHEV